MFGPLVPKEIDRGMNVLVKLSQIESFNDEITLLSTNNIAYWLWLLLLIRMEFCGLVVAWQNLIILTLKNILLCSMDDIN